MEATGRRTATATATATAQRPSIREKSPSQPETHPAEVLARLKMVVFVRAFD